MSIGTLLRAGPPGTPRTYPPSRRLLPSVFLLSFLCFALCSCDVPRPFPLPYPFTALCPCSSSLASRLLSLPCPHSQRNNLSICCVHVLPFALALRSPSIIFICSSLSRSNFVSRSAGSARLTSVHPNMKITRRCSVPQLES